MNVVLLADKKVRKNFEIAVKENANIDLLGVEMVIRGNTVSRIAEHHNPHILVIYSNVPEKEGIGVDDVITLLRIKKPNMRIIYVYGQIEDKDKFAYTANFLIENGITDIVTDTDVKKILETIESPMTKDDVMAIIEDLFTEENAEESEEEIDEIAVGQTFDDLNIDFPTVVEKKPFDIDTVMYVTSEHSEKEILKIGVAELQHHNGCTHTSFEIATMLSRKTNTAVVIADEQTFENISVFNKINPLAAKNGLSINGIDVFSYSSFNGADEYNVIIYDFSYLKDEHKKAFMECDVKIMLGSSAEWDISILTRFIRYDTDNYAKDIHFLFPRVSPAKFVKYNKLFMRSGVKAYRLHNSPDWTKPHTENITVYKTILNKHTVTSKPKKSKRRLIKAK